MSVIPFTEAVSLLAAPIRSLHIGHSSVGLLANGMCIETRRGSLRLFDIPQPMVWNSTQEWAAMVPTMHFDLQQRPLPPHFNSDQAWFAQWHEASTLHEFVDMQGTMIYQPEPVATLLALDSQTEMLVPVYMNLLTGTLYANNMAFTSMSCAPIVVTQVWRQEAGTYYRIL